MLNFEEFQEYVESTIREFLPESLGNAEVNLHTVMKNNNKELHSILVKPEGSNIAPTIYLEDFFKKYQDGKDLDMVVSDIARVAAEHIVAPKCAQSIASEFMNFDAVKDRIIMTVVNTEMNHSMLENTPHMDKEDLSFIYKVMLDEPEMDGLATITIKQEHMEAWGVTVEELHEYALKNSQEMLPAKVSSMNDIMLEMLERDGLPEEVIESMIMNLPPENQMYVITNSQSVNGASAVFYKDTLSELSEKLGNVDLYILPSSVHECIAVSTDMGTPDMLAEMVQEVNGTQVAVEEQLSDHVYKFDAKTKDITLADTTVEEIKKDNPKFETEAADEGARAARRHR